MVPTPRRYLRAVCQAPVHTSLTAGAPTGRQAGLCFTHFVREEAEPQEIHPL